MHTSKKHNELLPYLFREEYAKMTAYLCRHFGLKHIAIAEDIASDTFLKATEHWKVHGIPDSPKAWLYTVAKNKTKDYFKHISVVESNHKNNKKFINERSHSTIEFNEQLISDSQLAMIFVVCNPAYSIKSQICLALQILCGFSLDEIANAFFENPETIKKRLHRARKKLRNDNFQIQTLNKNEIEKRLSTVLKTLYLLFNEGYFSKTDPTTIRKELCVEATRLTLYLSEHPLTSTPATNALLALMCYQSSRLDARAYPGSEGVLFEKQNRMLWDQSLIQRGHYYLVEATKSNEISKYHLEAGIAYWHSTSKDKKKWKYILQLYNQLILLEYSPITALNRAFAYAKVYGKTSAITEVEKLKLFQNSYYFELLGYLYADTNINKAIELYSQSLRIAKSTTQRQTLTNEIERLRRKMHNRHS